MNPKIYWLNLANETAPMELRAYYVSEAFPPENWYWSIINRNKKDRNWKSKTEFFDEGRIQPLVLTQFKGQPRHLFSKETPHLYKLTNSDCILFQVSFIVHSGALQNIHEQLYIFSYAYVKQFIFWVMETSKSFYFSCLHNFLSPGLSTNLCLLWERNLHKVFLL